MFTFGIFSTHLPYLLFAFFYVYLLIFGLEKTSGCVSDDHLYKNKIELCSSDFQDQNEEKTIRGHSFDTGLTEYYHKQFIRKKREYIDGTLNGYPTSFILRSFFCRPPPLNKV